MRQFELKKYEHWPSKEAMLKIDGDNYDYIALSFEILSKKEEENKANKHYAVIYLYIDCYEKKLSVSFDIPSVEDTTDNYYFFKEENSKPNTHKTVHLENGRESVKLKNKKCTSSIENKNFQDAINEFIALDIITDVAQIEIFLKEHEISYDKSSFDELINEFSTNVLKHFSEESLRGILKEKYTEINSSTINNNLRNTLGENKIIKSIKI